MPKFVLGKSSESLPLTQKPVSLAAQLRISLCFLFFFFSFFHFSLCICSVHTHSQILLISRATQMEQFAKLFA